MPRINVPNAPIPVQIAYAVPKGRVFNAKDNNMKLAINETAVKDKTSKLLEDCNCFNPTAQATSNTPAKKSINQDI